MQYIVLAKTGNEKIVLSTYLVLYLLHFDKNFLPHILRLFLQKISPENPSESKSYKELGQHWN